MHENENSTSSDNRNCELLKFPDSKLHPDLLFKECPMTQQTSHSHFATQSRTVLSGSEKRPVALADGKKAAAAGEQLTVSVIVRRKKPLSAAHAAGEQRLTHARFNADHGADPEAVALVKRFAEEFGLKAEPGMPAPGRRTVKLTGTVADMQRAFGVSLSHCTIEGETYRVRDGSILLPSELQGYVVAVLGLDNRPQAKPHFRVLGEVGAAHAETPAAQSSFTPVQVGQLYQFPQGITASGQTIGIIELGGGFRQADIAAYFKLLKQKPPTVIAVPVGEGKNNPGNPNGADGEVMLDIEVSGAVAPGARIVVYFAPNTDQGFVDAIAQAVHDTKYKPSVISISWGSAEVDWTPQAMAALDAACQSATALGITITVAAGDNGSSDGVSDKKNHVDFPASSPHVLACGGTRLVGSGSSISNEVVWDEQPQGGGATGGGVSNVFPLPSWQVGQNVPQPTTSTGGRGVPDVAGDADPETGYLIRVDGKTMVIGGTSAVAPLWAGLIAVANQQNGAQAGFVQPALYAAKNKGAFRDTTSGDNGTFRAGPGWDACTGLGTPIAPRVISAVNPAASGPTHRIAASRKKVATRKSR
jgi:kumamolisin